MSIGEYLGSLEFKLQELGGLVTSWLIEREIDTNLGIGFIKGHITFVDGSSWNSQSSCPLTDGSFACTTWMARTV